MFHLFQPVIEYSYVGIWLLGAVVGVIFIVHGFPKIKNPKGIASAYHAPAVVGLYHGLIEVLGGAVLILGIHIHGTALVLAIIMVGAIYFKVNKWNVPFTAHDKNGWEFDLLLLAACLAIFLS